jgi:UDP-N-acetylglucosamine 2-epimerase (non-hydrolysing)
MKAAPVMAQLALRDGFPQTLVHTGQHYDDSMSRVFFRDLGMGEPDVNLGVGSGSHAKQTGLVMMGLETVFTDCPPDLVLVYGDVNSTLAAALVCAKMRIPLGHIEAGLRSFDRTMPEEVNRVVTDRLADFLFTPSVDGNRNLKQEGVADDRVHFVGNVMIDSLVALLPRARRPVIAGLEKAYVLVTLHRPSNVDEPATLKALMATLGHLSRNLQVLFPVHPRTRTRLNELGIAGGDASLKLIEPLGYLEFLGLEREATLVITDSGGVQEETTYLGIPCLTVRENTERPITCELGTNTLVGRDVERLLAEAERALAGVRKQGRVPPLWDGKAGFRIADIIVRDGTEAGNAVGRRGRPDRSEVKKGS